MRAASRSSNRICHTATPDGVARSSNRSKQQATRASASPSASETACRRSNSYAIFEKMRCTLTLELASNTSNSRPKRVTTPSGHNFHAYSNAHAARKATFGSPSRAICRASSHNFSKTIRSPQRCTDSRERFPDSMASRKASPASETSPATPSAGIASDAGLPCFLSCPMFAYIGPTK